VTGRIAGEAIMRREELSHADFLRDIFCPFRPPVVDLGWLATAVVSLANAIYSEKAFDRLPILADALKMPVEASRKY